MGYVGAWVKLFFTWVIIFEWIEWVKYIFAWILAWVKIFCAGAKFFRGSKIFAWSFFYFFFFVGQLLFTRWDYFTILQLIVWEFFFSLVSSQQIFTKPCLTPLVFLNRICKIDDIQWYFYERATKFYFWAANWPYSQRGCEYSKTSCSSQTPQASFENSTHLWKLFTEKKILKECCIMS